MKKSIIFFLFATLLFAACEQPSEDLISASEVKIFMSGADENAQLRSTDERQAIQQGDTVDVYNVQNINLVLTAEEENGNAIDGIWSFYNVDNDQNVNRYDTIVRGLPTGSASGSAMSAKLTILGLYKVYFQRKNGENFHFYIRHTGTPGIIGDDWENEYVFRLDNGYYQTNNADAGKGYTLYLKYQDDDFLNFTMEGVNPSLENNWHALVVCNNSTFTTKEGNTLSGKEFGLKKCKYSPGYICFTFLTNMTPAVNNRYSVYFYSGDFGSNWWIFRSIDRSNWSTEGKIVFQTI